MSDAASALTERLHHLDLVQGVITRMASNSFALKTWTVGLASAILALDFAQATKGVGFVALLPLLAFWWLDAYYLLQERIYRALYTDIVSPPEDPDDRPKSLHLNAWQHVTHLPNWRRLQTNLSWWPKCAKPPASDILLVCGVMLSPTLLVFYGALAAAVVLVTVLATPV